MPALPDIARLGGHTMGTTWSAVLAAPADADLHALHAGIERRLDTVVRQMSTWRADSDISRFNRSEAGQWQVLPDEFLAVLACALDVAALSGGAYDPTVGPLVEAWGFGPACDVPRIPDEAELAALRRRVGWQRLLFQPEQRRVLQPGLAALDLSAIAKGYAADLVAHRLREDGIDAALVEVGGELVGYGRKPDGQPWRVLVESAAEEDAAAQAVLPPRVLALDGLAVATSGDRWHRFERGGQHYAHTLDARSGRPVTRAAAAVSVVARDAMHADAWATALTVMGAVDGLAFAERHGLAARFVTRTDAGPVETMTPAFSQHLAA